MNKSPKYNQQQTRSRQWKSEVEKLHIYQKPAITIAASISENKSWLPC